MRFWRKAVKTLHTHKHAWAPCGSIYSSFIFTEHNHDLSKYNFNYTHTPTPIDGFTSKPRISILLNVQERQKKGWIILLILMCLILDSIFNFLCLIFFWYITPERPGIKILIKKHFWWLICNNIHLKWKKKIKKIEKKNCVMLLPGGAYMSQWAFYPI